MLPGVSLSSNNQLTNLSKLSIVRLFDNMSVFNYSTTKSKFPNCQNDEQQVTSSVEARVKRRTPVAILQILNQH